MAAERVKEIIAKIRYVTIASVTEEGEPWNTPVYAGYDNAFNFYWVSSKGTQHSQNIRRHPKVFISIYDSTVPEGTGEGVYVQARVVELDNRDDIVAALPHYYERKNKQKPQRAPEEFLGDSQRRMYKAVPEKVWTNGYDPERLDFRVYISLL